MLRRCSLLALAATLGLPLSSAMAQEKAAAPVAKQDSSSAIDPAAKDFIDKFRAAVKGINDISCTVSQTMTNGDTTTAQSGDLLAVFARHDDGTAALKQFKIASKNPRLDAVWSFDGKKAYKIDHTAKTFAMLDAGENDCIPVGEASMVVPNWIFGTDILSQKTAKLVGAAMLPDAEMDGVKCRVIEYRVEVVYPNPPSEDGTENKDEPRKLNMRQVRHVGAADLIARKIESAATYSGGNGDPIPPMSLTGSYSNIKLNFKPTTDAFALTAPTGYKIEKDPDASELGIRSDEAPKLKFAVGDIAPAFALKNSDGSEISLDSLKGRVVLLDFWATWCGPCKMAMPGVQKLHEKYKDQKVSIFGVNTWERGASAEAKITKASKYITDKKYTYGQLFAGDDLAKQYGMSGIPTFILIGPDGKIVYLGVGFDEKQDELLADLIDKTLAGK